MITEPDPGIRQAGGENVRAVSTLIGLFVLSVSGAAVAADGAALFAKNCSGCHGADAKADTAAAKAMKVPAIAGHDAEATVNHIRTDEKHKSLSAKLNDEDLQAIAGFLASAQ